MNVGQEVCAIREDLVIKVKEHFTKGGRNKKYRDFANLIIIAHKDGTFAQYVHLKKDGAIVNEGETVKKGQVIGFSGNTGMSTEPHLHFTVYKPTKNGFISMPYILDSIPTKRYKKGKFAKN
jgi:murein DD-endopeptidase MepM/ murein hydrolase activator NlpD